MARGTIINRGTKESPNYSVVIEGARDPVTGKRKQYWHSGYGTKTAAEEARTRVLREIDTGRYVEQSKVTMRDFMDEWLTAIKPTVRESTWQTYSLLVRVHIVPNLGNVKVQRLTPATLNSFYNKLQTEGKKSQRTVQKCGTTEKPRKEPKQKEEKKGLSARSVRNIHVVIHKALDYAVVHNLVQKNVAKVANAPRAARFGEHEMKTWEAAQLRVFLESIQENRYYPAYCTRLDHGDETRRSTRSTLARLGPGERGTLCHADVDKFRLQTEVLTTQDAAKPEMCPARPEDHRRPPDPQSQTGGREAGQGP